MISLRVFAAATLAVSGVARPASAPMTNGAAAEGTVLSLLVRPDSGRVDVVVGVRGKVTTKDFILRGPDRIVLDISNASLGLARGQAYDHAARGGIVNVHYAQRESNVVRVVLTLESPHAYRVAREAEGIRISVQGATSTLPAWAVGYVNASIAAAAAEPVAAVERYVEPKGPPAPRYVREAASTKPAPKMTSAEEAASLWVNGKNIAIKGQQSQNRRITINFDNQSIIDVLKIFSEYSGHSILPSNAVKGTVSASINDVPWDVALKAILNLNGYDAREDQYGIIYVDSFNSVQSKAASLPMASRTIRFNYTNAAAIEAALKARLSRDCGTVTQTTPAPLATTTTQQTTPPPTDPNAPPVQPAQPAAAQAQPTVTVTTTGNCPVRGAVTTDTLTNSVSITDIPDNLDQLEAYARTLDVRQPQVNIKAKIILVDRSALEGLGLRYDLGSQTQFFSDLVPRVDTTGSTTGGQVSLGGNTISAIANAALRVPNATLQLIYSTALGAFDLTTFFEAAQTLSLLDVQAEPNGTVLTNRTLSLQAGTDVVLPSAAGVGATAAPTIRRTGVILEVTPRVTIDGRVQMRIHVENSDISANGEFPTQTITNEVMILDGATWVIGGLTQTTVTSARTGIPLLIDLPIIGRLFGVTTRNERKRDLLILITPHIVDPGQDVGNGH